MLPHPLVHAPHPMTRFRRPPPLASAVQDGGTRCGREVDDLGTLQPGCNVPVLSLSKLDAATDVLGPMMLLPDANVTWRHVPWAAKKKRAFFRGVPSCGLMWREPGVCGRTVIARVAQLNPDVLDAGARAAKEAASVCSWDDAPSCLPVRSGTQAHFVHASDSCPSRCMWGMLSCDPVPPPPSHTPPRRFGGAAAQRPRGLGQRPRIEGRPRQAASVEAGAAQHAAAQQGAAAAPAAPCV